MQYVLVGAEGAKSSGTMLPHDVHDTHACYGILLTYLVRYISYVSSLEQTLMAHIL